MAQVILCAGISFLTYMRPVGTYQLANVLRNEGYTVQVIDSFPYIAKKGYQTVIDLFEHFVQEDTLWIGFSTTWFKKLDGTEGDLDPRCMASLPRNDEYGCSRGSNEIYD